MPYTDDPYMDFKRHDAEQTEWLERLPKCCHCGQAIQDDRLWDVEGNLYHMDCAEEEFGKFTEDYIE